MSNKSLLIKSYNEALRQTERLKSMVKTKEDEYQKLVTKISTAGEVEELSIDAIRIIAEVELENNRLEKIATKAENLAARENSRQNSTPEAREVNQQIEIGFERLHKLDRTVTQLSMDIVYLQHEIEAIAQIQTEKKDASNTRLTALYANIQNLREEASKFRFSNLNSLLNKQYNLSLAEVEFHKNHTFYILYQQLLNSLNAEFNSSKDMKTASFILQGELDKLISAVNSIPNHSIIDNSVIGASSSECSALVSRIDELETKIMASIKVMAQAEDELDETQRLLRECIQKNDYLKRQLQEITEVVDEKKNTIQTLRDKDANKINDAIEEIDRLKTQISTLEQQNERRKKEISRLKKSDVGAMLISQARSPLEMLRNSIVKEVHELSSQAENLQLEEAALKARLSRNFRQ